MSTAILVGFLVAAAVLAWWAPPPLSRLDPQPSPLPGWVGKAWGWVVTWRSGRRKTDRAVVRELPETLELLAVCLEAGAPMTNAIASSASTTPASSRSARSPSATCSSTEATGAPVRSATRHAPATRARPSRPGVCATSCSAAGTSPPRVATAETGARASQSVAASASAAVGICPARSSMARPTVTRVVSSARLRRMRSAVERRSIHAAVPTHAQRSWAAKRSGFSRATSMSPTARSV